MKARIIIELENGSRMEEIFDEVSIFQERGVCYHQGGERTKIAYNGQFRIQIKAAKGCAFNNFQKETYSWDGLAGKL